MIQNCPDVPGLSSKLLIVLLTYTMRVIMCNQLLLFGIARTYGTGGYRHFSRLEVNVPSSAEVAARPEVWQRSESWW